MPQLGARQCLRARASGPATSSIAARASVARIGGGLRPPWTNRVLEAVYRQPGTASTLPQQQLVGRLTLARGSTTFGEPRRPGRGAGPAQAVDAAGRAHAHLPVPTGSITSSHNRSILYQEDLYNRPR
jgi:hypothetical protein